MPKFSVKTKRRPGKKSKKSGKATVSTLEAANQSSSSSGSKRGLPIIKDSRVMLTKIDQMIPELRSSSRTSMTMDEVNLAMDKFNNVSTDKEDDDKPPRLFPQTSLLNVGPSSSHSSAFSEVPKGTYIGLLASVPPYPPLPGVGDVVPKVTGVEGCNASRPWDNGDVQNDGEDVSLGPVKLMTKYRVACLNPRCRWIFAEKMEMINHLENDHLKGNVPVPKENVRAQVPRTDFAQIFPTLQRQDPPPSLIISSSKNSPPNGKSGAGRHEKRLEAIGIPDETETEAPTPQVEVTKEVTEVTEMLVELDSEDLDSDWETGSSSEGASDGDGDTMMSGLTDEEELARLEEDMMMDNYLIPDRFAGKIDPLDLALRRQRIVELRLIDRRIEQQLRDNIAKGKLTSLAELTAAEVDAEFEAMRVEEEQQNRRKQSVQVHLDIPQLPTGQIGQEPQKKKNKVDEQSPVPQNREIYTLDLGDNNN